MRACDVLAGMTSIRAARGGSSGLKLVLGETPVLYEVVKKKIGLALRFVVGLEVDFILAKCCHHPVTRATAVRLLRSQIAGIW